MLTGRTSTPHTTFSFALPLRSGTMVLPHQPRPTTATPSGSIFLVCGSAGFFYRLAPALGFGGHELREFARGAGDHLHAAVREALHDFGRLHRVEGDGIEPLDDLLRRAGGHEDALPRAAGELGEARLGHRRRAGERVEA